MKQTVTDFGSSFAHALSTLNSRLCGATSTCLYSRAPTNNGTYGGLQPNCSGAKKRTALKTSAVTASKTQGSRNFAILTKSTPTLCPPMPGKRSRHSRHSTSSKTDATSFYTAIPEQARLIWRQLSVSPHVMPDTRCCSHPCQDCSRRYASAATL